MTKEVLSPQCLPISPSGRRLRNAHLRHSVTRAARTRNAPALSDDGNASTTSSQSPSPRKKGSRSFPCISGAGKESRTLDLNLGKVALYQLSYSRIYYRTPLSPSVRISKSQIIALFFAFSAILKKFRKIFANQSLSQPNKKGPEGPCCIGFNQWCSGGAVRSRTGLTGFAIRGITALLPRQKNHFPLTKKGS